MYVSKTEELGGRDDKKVKCIRMDLITEAIVCAYPKLRQILFL